MCLMYRKHLNCVFNLSCVVCSVNVIVKVFPLSIITGMDIKGSDANDINCTLLILSFLYLMISLLLLNNTLP